MTFTDTHCHLADPKLADTLPAILAEAQAVGVARFVVPATSPKDWHSVAQLERPSENIHIALGIHPWFSDGLNEAAFQELEKELIRHPQAWVGEIGLDFYGKKQTQAQRDTQTDVFIRQLILAQNLNRRVIIHNLKATAAIAAAVKTTGFTRGGIVHAFSGSVEEVRILVKLGFKIGIGSLLLNPNAKKVRAALQALDDRDFILETDSPFMLGHETNTPANIRRIAEIAAELRGVPLAQLSEITEQNVNSLLHTSP